MSPHDNALERCTPVNVLDTGSTHDDPRAPQKGIALCLSGGGYRAMLFHLGALWRLNELGYLTKLDRIHIADYHTPGALPCPEDKTLILANTKTRLKRLDSVIQERIINWGYAVCDAAMRKWVDPMLPSPQGFPYGTAGVG